MYNGNRKNLHIFRNYLRRERSYDLEFGRLVEDEKAHIENFLTKKVRGLGCSVTEL